MEAPFVFVAKPGRANTILTVPNELPSFDEATRIVTAHATRWGRFHNKKSRIALEFAAGRVLAEPLKADMDQPPFPRSTRDGFACRAEDANAGRWLRVAGTTHAGERPRGPLPKGAAWEIMTGAAVPPGANAVAMLEHVEHGSDGVRLSAGRELATGENVVAKGAQARKGKVLLEAGTRIGPAQIALAAACGHSRIAVKARPRVAILTTGDELVGIADRPGPGQIRNSNAAMLAALVEAAGGAPVVLATAGDTERALRLALRQAMRAEMLLVSGGVSAGKRDLVEPVLASMGAKFHFTGVRIQPGKPLVFGEVPRKGKAPLPVFGLPGNPISSAATFLLFGTRVLNSLGGQTGGGPRFVMARLGEGTKGRGNAGLTRFFPAKCEFDPGAGELPEVSTVPWQGSGDLPAFGESNCFLVVPEGVASLNAGDVSRILLI